MHAVCESCDLSDEQLSLIKEFSFAVTLRCKGSSSVLAGRSLHMAYRIIRHAAAVFFLFCFPTVVFFLFNIIFVTADRQKMPRTLIVLSVRLCASSHVFQSCKIFKACSSKIVGRLRL